MKKIGLGLGILIFAVLFQLCSSGMEMVSLAIGASGLIVVILGSTEK